MQGRTPPRPVSSTKGAFQTPRSRADFRDEFRNVADDTAAMMRAVGKGPPVEVDPNATRGRFSPEIEALLEAGRGVDASETPVTPTGLRGEAPARTPRAPRVDATAIQDERPKAPPVRKKFDVREEDTPVDVEGRPLSNDYERLDMPSGFAFYDFADFHTKRLGVRDAAKVARAVRFRNMTVLVDALSAIATRDVRDLCLPDFEALCLWHKFNSYLKSPMEVTWTTRYGNRATVTTQTYLREDKRPFTASAEEVVAARSQGLTLPTVRDMEVLLQVDDGGQGLDADDLYIFDRAQYLEVDYARAEALRKSGDPTPTVRARIERLEEMGDARADEGRLATTTLDDVDAFAAKFANFGVDEYCVIRDPEFDPRKFAEVDPTELRADVLPEWNACREYVNLVAAGHEDVVPPTAEKEEVHIPFDMWNCFRAT